MSSQNVNDCKFVTEQDRNSTFICFLPQKIISCVNIYEFSSTITKTINSNNTNRII